MLSAILIANLLCASGKPVIVRHRYPNFEPVSSADGPRLGAPPPLPSTPRSREIVRWTVSQRDSAVHRCYTWARARQPELRGRLIAQLYIDPFGQTRAAVEPTSTEEEELAACVQDMLQGLRVRGFVARRTRAWLPIEFEYREGAPLRRIPRPRLRAFNEPVGHVCLPLPAELPVDEIVENEPVMRIVEFPTETFNPGIWFRSSPDEATRFRKAIGANAGAYGACNADFQWRRPGLAPRVEMHVLVDAAGIVQRAEVVSSTVKDAPLLDCLREEFSSTWYPAADDARWLDARITLVLEPSSQ